MLKHVFFTARTCAVKNQKKKSIIQPTLFQFLQNIVTDGIKEATSFVMKDPVLEAQKRQKAIMNDCISSTLSDLNPKQLEDFYYVSNNLTAIIQMAFDEGTH